MACSRGWRDAGQRLLATRGSGTRGHRSFLRARPERRGNHTPPSRARSGSPPSALAWARHAIRRTR